MFLTQLNLSTIDCLMECTHWSLSRSPLIASTFHYWSFPNVLESIEGSAFIESESNGNRGKIFVTKCFSTSQDYIFQPTCVTIGELVGGMDQ